MRKSADITSCYLHLHAAATVAGNCLQAARCGYLRLYVADSGYHQLLSSLPAAAIAGNCLQAARCGYLRLYVRLSAATTPAAILIYLRLLYPVTVFRLPYDYLRKSAAIIPGAIFIYLRLLYPVTVFRLPAAATHGYMRLSAATTSCYLHLQYLRLVHQLLSSSTCC